MSHKTSHSSSGEISFEGSQFKNVINNSSKKSMLLFSPQTQRAENTPEGFDLRSRHVKLAADFRSGHPLDALNRH